MLPERRTLSEHIDGSGETLAIADTASCIHICTGGPKLWVRAVIKCPTCKTRRRFSGFEQAWYGITWTCCHCGDTWSDGCRMPRPCSRGWRVKAAAEAKSRWTDAVALRSPVRQEWLRREVEFATEDFG